MAKVKKAIKKAAKKAGKKAAKKSVKKAKTIDIVVDIPPRTGRDDKITIPFPQGVFCCDDTNSKLDEANRNLLELKNVTDKANPTNWRYQQITKSFPADQGLPAPNQPGIPDNQWRLVAIFTERRNSVNRNTYMIDNLMAVYERITVV